MKHCSLLLFIEGGKQIGHEGNTNISVIGSDIVETMQKILIANWKSHKSLAAASQWVEQYVTALGSAEVRAKVVLAPGFSLLQTVHEAVVGFSAPLQLGAQDVSPFPLGSYTGAVAATQLKDFGITHCLVGHSERRIHLHESHQDVSSKISRLCEVGITPVLCLDSPYIAEQANCIDANLYSQLIVAYEPLSAIGTGHTPDIATVAAVLTEMRGFFGESVPVLYGGSVDADNIAEFLLVSDGALIGGASLDGAQFAAVVRAV